MTTKKLDYSIKPKVTTIPYSIVEDGNTPRTAEGKIAAGSVSIAYTGGGEWVVVCIDRLKNNSSTVRFKIRKNGEILKFDRKTGQELTYGKLDLSIHGNPNVTEFDIVRDYQALQLLLTEGVSEHHTETLEAHPDALVLLSATGRSFD
jgi:hypothetical protein